MKTTGLCTSFYLLLALLLAGCAAPEPPPGGEGADGLAADGAEAFIGKLRV